MNNIFCPYPGLRPFEEEEAIFFKGRDNHIKGIISQLEKKHFVMITGASGDGKSSIVHAGMIPNIKAGFARGHYNQWEFAIIKPEGNPLQNLNRELSNIFRKDEQSLYDELSLGFSALVDVYTGSELCIDENGSEWHSLDIRGKRELRKKGRNLFILVDQFEELFTNSENYLHGEPSLEAETLVNLLIETVNLANTRNLPIYVVFTMRSDFIGNCAAFRRLPELIGNSHFFIPRLNREEIEKVIVEPALLNDDLITPQLSNQLVAAASDGADQLPIVQFALNRVWHIAKGYNEPMDLIHLAMAGGIDPLELSELDRQRFMEYRNSMPENIRTLFDNPSLRNVLNVRANQLIRIASQSFQSVHPNVTEDEIQKVLRLCFEGLTKTDGGRMVRHRSSLLQLTQLVGNSTFTEKELALLLLPFREEGDCFLYPSTHQLLQLQSNHFLEISHEALIRNWELLRAWTQENAASVAEYHDLRTQMNRWKESGEKQNFLLALGPLEQFEMWLKESHISAYWIAKNESSGGNYDENLSAAEITLSEVKAYLKASRDYLDLKMRYKKKRARFIMSLGTIAILILSILSVWAVQQKNLAKEQTNLAEEKRLEAENSRASAAQSAEVAITKEQEALMAKSDAERAASLANEQRSIAEAKTIFANQQQLLAQSEANRANQEAEKAREQKNAAENARQEAEQSEKKARTLTNRAFTQVLAFMAHQTLYNPFWSAQFAHHALQRHLEQGGNKMDPVIFNACFESLTKAIGKDNAFNVEGSLKLWNSGAQLSIPNFNSYLKPLPANCIFQSSNGPTILTQNGFLISLSADSLKYSYLDIIGDGISFASFDEHSGILFNQSEFYMDKKIDKNCKYLPVAAYDSRDYNQIVNAWPCIPGLGILKGAKYFPASNKYLLLSKSGTSFASNRILHLRGTAEDTWKTKKINDDILATTTLPDGILAATQSGKLIFINENNEFTEITIGQKKPLPCYALTPSIGMSFYAGYSDGSIDYFNFSEGKWSTQKIHLARGVMVRNLAYNSNIGTLAAAFSDNTIAIVKENQKTLYIEMDEGTSAIGLTNGNYLVVNLANASTKVIPLDLEILNRTLCNVLNDFTAEQWREIFGDEYPFKPINCED